MRPVLLCLSLCLVTAPSAAREAPLPAAKAFVLNWTREAGTLRVQWRMPEGYYLYRAHIEAMDEAGRPLKAITPKGVHKDDATFGGTEVYYRTARARIVYGGAVSLTYRGCQDNGLCYMPVTVHIPAAPASHPPVR